MVQTVGIRIEDDHLAIAAIERQDGKLVLSAFHRIARREKQSVQKALSDLFAKSRWDRHAVVLSLGAKHCVLRKIEVPFGDPAQIDQIISSETEPHIPAHAIEDLVIDYQIMRRVNGKTRLLAVAAQRKIIGELLALVEPCGIYPFAIEVDIFGAVHLARWSEEIRSCRHLLLLDAQSDGFHLAFLDGGNLTHFRSVRFQVRSLMEGMLGDMDDTLELQIETGDGVPAPSPELSPLQIGKFHERVLKELTRTLPGLDPVDKFYLTGPLEQIQGLPAFLEKHGIAASLWDISQSVGIAQDVAREDISRAPAVIGLALKAMGQTSGGINFRKEEFRYAKAFDVIKRPLALTLSLLFLLLAGMALYLHTLCREQSRTYDALLARAETICQRTNPGATLAQIPRWNRIYEVRRLLEESLEGPKLPPIQDTFKIWAKLFDALGQVRKDHFFTVESLRIDQQEAQFAGRAENDLVLDAVKRHLSQTDWIALSPDSLRALSTEPAPGHPKLKRRYKYQAQFKAE